MNRCSKVRFYRRVRAALLATNKRTYNSIITECNIVMPLANDKGTNVSINNMSKSKNVKVKKVCRSRNDFQKKFL